MVRTQIYLTESEREGLAGLAEATGKKQSELIRLAVDRLIDQSSADRREAILDSAAGMWRERSDLPEVSATRRSWDRT